MKLLSSQHTVRVCYQSFNNISHCRNSGHVESMLEDDDDSSSSDEELEVGKTLHGGHKVSRHDIIMKVAPDLTEDVCQSITKKGFFKSSRTKYVCLYTEMKHFVICLAFK